MAGAPAGWLPDPDDSTQFRYWDGERWTDDRAPRLETPVATGAPSAGAVAPPATKKSKGGLIALAIVLGVGALVLLLIVVAAIASSSGEDEIVPIPETTEAVVSPTPTEAASESPTPMPSPDPIFETQTYSGTGDFVVDTSFSDPALVTFTCATCEGNVVLESDSDNSLIVNEIGAYSGRSLINVEEGSAVTRFVITADAAWTLTLEDLSVVEPAMSPTAKSGDDVVVWVGSDVVRVTHDGEANFVLYAYGEGSIDLVINEIGVYDGTVVIPPGFVEIKADGNWTLTDG